MPARLLICTDLDRTLMPNGTEPESPGARAHFASLVARPEAILAYVSGRHRALVEDAIAGYALPRPDFVLGDVGTTIYRVGAGGEWTRWDEWERQIARDWNGRTHAELARALADIRELQPQEPAKQNTHKLSYYLPRPADRERLSAALLPRLERLGVQARLVWSDDEMSGSGLLDVLPARASKLHAIEALMRARGFADENTVFCGDSGNDLEVLASAIPAVLVANSAPELQALAIGQAEAAGHADRLYVARGGFMGMNGNYAAGVLEGIAHYHPATIPWMGFADTETSA